MYLCALKNNVIITTVRSFPQLYMYVHVNIYKQALINNSYK